LPSYYELSEVKEKIKNKQYYINSNAVKGAFQGFGWGIDDILRVYKNLKKSHYYKSANSQNKPMIVIDVYKASISGENIYTHFYIENDNLIINSFHKQ
jgi:hypothetical protein